MPGEDNYARWVKALRETEHPQTCGGMHDGSGYCVYGILEKEVFGEEFTLGSTDVPLQREFGWNDSLGMNLEPHPSRIQEMGLDRPVSEEEWALAGRVFIPKASYRTMVTRLDLLGQMNDAGTPFAAIAYFMEKCGWQQLDRKRSVYLSAVANIMGRKAVA